MSLINQMLRDLEQRRKTGVRELPSGESPAVFGVDKNSRRLLFIVVGGILLIGLVWAGLNYAGRTMKVPSSTVKLPAVSMSALQLAPQLTAGATKRQADGPLKSATAGPVEQTSGTAAADVTAAGAVKESLPVVNVANLLNLAVLESATSSRLMLEFEQRPEYRWQFINESESLLKIRLPQTRAQSALKVPRIQGSLLKQIRIEPGEQELALIVETSAAVKLNTLELPADSFYGQRLLLELSRQVQVAAAPVAKASRVEKRIVELTPQEQAQKAYSAGVLQLQQGNYPGAEKQFIQALELHPALLVARVRLVTLLQELQRLDEATDLLLQGLALHPESAELRKGYARRLMVEGQLIDAVDLLQSGPRPELASDLEYYALLAALQQETGEHSAAAQNYQRLLDYQPQQALWWLGLAISMEQTGNRPEAKRAYQQALEKPGLRADLQVYANGRFQEL